MKDNTISVNVKSNTPSFYGKQKRKMKTSQSVSSAGAITKAKSQYKIIPNYPESAILREEEGTVHLKFTVTKNGKAKNIQVVSSPGIESLTKAAIQSIKNASFDPALKNAEQIESILEIAINFKLK